MSDKIKPEKPTEQFVNISGRIYEIETEYPDKVFWTEAGDIEIVYSYETPSEERERVEYEDLTILDKDGNVPE